MLALIMNDKSKKVRFLGIRDMTLGEIEEAGAKAAARLIREFGVKPSEADILRAEINHLKYLGELGEDIVKAQAETITLLRGEVEKAWDEGRDPKLTGKPSEWMNSRAYRISKGIGPA